MSPRSRLALLFSLLASLGPLLPFFPGRAQASEAGPVVVDVASSLAYLDQQALRGAIGSELHAAAIRPGDDAAGARGTLLLGLDRASGELIMTYRPRSGALLMRKIKLPAERGDQITTIALLAGNLARDEASELLASLQATSASPSASPSASATGSGSGSGSASGSPSPSGSASGEASIAPMPVPAPASPAEKKPGCSRRRPRWEPASAQVVPGVGYPMDHDFHTHAALSLAGTVGEVRGGAHLGLLGAFTLGDVRGANLAGLVSLTGGAVEGVSAAALVQLGGCDATGLVGAGLVSLQRGSVDGVAAAGLVSAVGGRHRGLLGAALLAGAGGDVDGLVGAGLGTYVGGSVRGLQASGLANFAGGKVTGFQGSSLANVALGGVDGGQVGLVNVAGDVSGAQVGLVNFGGKVKGTQIGLINLADHMDGLPIGLFSLAGNTKLQGVFWVGPRPRFNLGLKMTTGYAYQMVSASYHGEETPRLYGLAYTLGLHFPIDRLFVDVDIGNTWLFPDLHLAEGDNLRWRSPGENWGKARVLAGLRLVGRLEAFVGGGLMGRYNAGPTADIRQEWSAGLQF